MVDMLAEIKMIEAGHLLRIRGELKKLIADLQNHVSKNREIALVLTNLEQGAMWLGKEMTNRGIFKPYTDEEQTIKE